jgi:hypothetical protein
MITAQNMRDFISDDEPLSIESYLDKRLEAEAHNARRFDLSSGWVRVYIDDPHNASEVVAILEDRGFTIDGWQPDYVLTCDIHLSW